MEFLRFCLEIIRREAEKFNVGVSISTANQLTAATADDVNYDNAHNRCAFLYRCGTINLSFTKDCFSKFLSDCNGIEYLLAKWRFDSHLTFCSITKGPALDYIALLLAHEQCRILPSLIRNIKIITKHGAWRNTANIMLEVINEGYFKNLSPSIGNIEVIQGDPFNSFTEKVKLPINDSDVIMMIKTLNLQSDGYDQEKVSKNIQEFLDALKPGAVLFCIDTKPSIKEITQILTAFSGKFLFQPTHINTMINLEYTELYKAHFKCLPVTSGRGCFFVWEKSLISPSNVYEKKISESIKHKINVTDEKVITDRCTLEPYYMTSLDKESKNCDQELLKHCNSYNRPKLDEGNSLANTHDFLLAENVKNYFQKSKCPLPSDSPINDSASATNYFKKESLNVSLNSLKSELDSISNNICMQTEPELSEGTEITKIKELTNKITDLTVELTKLLEINSLKPDACDNFSKHSEETCNLDTKVNSCSSEIACSRVLSCSQNFGTCCCQKFTCHQFCLSSNHNNNISTCGEVSNFCRHTNTTKSTFLAENASPSAAQLVIPLNSLSANVVSQIISLINQSHHEQK